ncbi:MAG: magnesium transporter [Rhodospirillales bacterium]|nr:magnesium transporter [Rhodospirillales bacterium]
MRTKGRRCDRCRAPGRGGCRPDGAGEGFELESTFIDAVADALQRDDRAQLHDLIADVHDADVADLLQSLDGERRRDFVEATRADFRPQVLAELNETVRDEVMEVLGPQETAAALTALETDDAVLVLSELGAAEQRQLLDEIPAEERALIEEGLGYPEYSAGRLMRRELVAVPTFWSVGETIDYLRHAADQEDNVLPQEFHDIFVVDPAHRPAGALNLSRLLRTRRPVPVTDIMETEIRVIATDTDQEDVAFLFRQRDLTSAPVVDRGGRLVGVITIDDVVDVIDEEHEQDFMSLGGVAHDDLYRATIDTARSRFTWLMVNLGTAILASLVIGAFASTIEQIVALAVLMPIVASMGGNAGTQTLTVAVRALATKELTPANAARVVSKELLVGVLNGSLFAVAAAAVAWLWFGSAGIAAVIALAMVANLVVAAFAGATIPLLLERYGVDPAIASGVFLTTVTDVVGFFAFLGLAALLLL